MVDTLRDLVAHSAPEGGGRPQSLHAHARNVAEMAGDFARLFDSEEIARWLGWWHDAGKADAGIQAYLKGEGQSRDHSSVGMLAVPGEMSLLAHNVAGHHGGLRNQTGEHSLKGRIQRKKDDARIQRVLAKVRPQVEPHAPTLRRDHLPDFLRSANGRASTLRRYDFWLRMLHSTLVDADCLDTERHFTPDRFAAREVSISIEDLWSLFQENQYAFMDSAAATTVNRRRRDVYEAAAEAAMNAPGFFQ